MDTYEKKIRDYMNSDIDTLYKSMLNNLFPELAESENERIRKDLIAIFKGEIPFTSEEDAKRYIAWLEKQGDSPIKWNKNTKDNKPQVNHSVLMKTTHGIAEGEWQGEQWHQYRWAGLVRDTDVLSWMELSDLEKQGEQKSFDYENANIQQKDFAPKVEPKFKVGDWVVRKDGEPFFNGNHYAQITVIDKEQYWFDSGTWLETKDIRLWSIKDAKDGDMLAEDSCVFIIRKLNHDLTAKTYCCLYDDGDFELGSNLGFDDTSTYPATKEQRDTLEKAMADEGYIFDFEKKELKEIEQKPIEENKGNLGGISPKWSEEDDDFLNDIINHFDRVPLKHQTHEIFGWLVSLKQRIGG